MCKILIFSTVLFVFTIVCHGQNPNKNYQVEGQINGAGNEHLYFSSHASFLFGHIDSVQMNNGSFQLERTFVHPDMYLIWLEGKNKTFFFFEGGKLNITGTTDSLSVTGKGVEEWQEFVARFYRVKQPVEQRNFIKDYVTIHPNSNLSPWLIRVYFAKDEVKAERASLYATLSEGVKQSYYGKELKKDMDSSHIISIGNVAPDFVQNDPQGKPVRLSDFRGKYLLLDFWASWCVPCRKENPNLVKVYHQFKNKNFEILGISLDSSSVAWLKAVEKDGITWSQVSDLKYWKNEVAQLYGVISIPQNVLLDTNGKIIALNLRGENLGEMLTELLK
jgi:peroxiredoxin